MRAGRAAGLTVAVIGAAAVVAWGAAVAAQQDQNTTTVRQRRPLVVTIDEQRDAPQRASAWVGQMGDVLTMGGPRLGVSIRDIEAADVTRLKLPGLAGVIVEDVTADSAGAKAGLKAGDVLAQFDGEAVRSIRQFTRLVGESVPGRTIKIVVMRDGKRLDVEATLTKADGPAANMMINREEIRRQVERGMAEARPLMRQFRLEPGMGAAVSRPGRLGVTLQELTPDLAAYFGVKDGVLVSAVRADSPAAKGGIHAGDVITTVNDKPVADVDAVMTQLRDKEGDVTIGLSRDRKPMQVKVAIEKATPPAKSKIVVRRQPA